MDDYIIIVDSREQKPYFTKNVEVAGLKTGDYSIKGYEDRIAIERKSIADLFGTLGKGNKRFKKELERSRSLEYFAIIIDGTFRQVRDKDFPDSYRTKMKGFVILKILFTLIVKYKVHVFFGGDRKQSKSIVKQLFDAYWRQQK